jgi:hypothetical protein
MVYKPLKREGVWLWVPLVDRDRLSSGIVRASPLGEAKGRYGSSAMLSEGDLFGVRGVDVDMREQRDLGGQLPYLKASPVCTLIITNMAWSKVVPRLCLAMQHSPKRQQIVIACYDLM